MRFKGDRRPLAPCLRNCLRKLSEFYPRVEGCLPMETDEQTRQWAMLLHLSQFAGYVLPLAGLVVPIIIWQVQKQEMPELDIHGKIVANWIVSQIIYGVVFLLLCLVVIGFPLLVALAVLSLAFPIIGALKANQGKAWKYPFSITFF